MVTAALLVVGTAGFLVAEWSNPGTLGAVGPGTRVLAAFTAAVMPRTAGFNNLDIAAYRSETLLLTAALMFIGGGSAGTAGGIKVTTFGLLAYVLWAEMRGDPDVEVGRRKVPGTNQRQALAIALLGIGVVAVATFLMQALSDFTFDQVLFETISAFATVGLSTGITADLPAAAQVLLVLLMYIGRIGPLALASGLALRERARRHQLPEERTIVGSHKDPVAVLGLGRFGTALALELARGGTEVLAVDRRPDVVQRLSGQLAQVVIADTTDLDALTEIGIADFSRVVVAIGNDLEASILTTALLTELGIRDIWAKAVNRQQATTFERIGAHHVVFPEQDMGERIAHLVAGRLLDWVELDPDWVFAKTKPPREIVGIPLGDTGLRKRHRVTVVSVKPGNATSFTHADYDTALTYGSVIVIGGRPADVERFVDLQ